MLVWWLIVAGGLVGRWVDCLFVFFDIVSCCII